MTIEKNKIWKRDIGSVVLISATEKGAEKMRKRILELAHTLCPDVETKDLPDEAIRAACYAYNIDSRREKQRRRNQAYFKSIAKP